MSARLSGMPKMHNLALVTVVAIVIGSAAPTPAADRPTDPFGNHTIELDKEATLFAVWEALRDRVLLDKAHFHSCIESSKSACPEVSTLMKIADEAYQY